MYVFLSYARAALVAVAILAMLASLHNVFGDNAELISEAKYTACPEKLCAMTQLERTPFAQTFRFVTPGGAPVVVRCRRAAVFVGEYSCEVEEEGR